MAPAQRRLEIGLPTLIEHTSFYQEGTRSPALRDIVPATDPEPTRREPRVRTISHGRSQSAPSRFLNNVANGRRHSRAASDTASSSGVSNLRRMTDTVLATMSRDSTVRPLEREEILISGPIPIPTESYPLEADDREPGTPTMYMSPEGKDSLHVPRPLSSPGSPASTATGTTLNENPLQPLRPSWRRLYSVTTVRERFTCLLPAILFSIASAMVTPYMTTIMGEAFSALGKFSMSPKAEGDKTEIMRTMGWCATKIVIIGLAAGVFGYLRNTLWVTYGELTANRLRRMVYDGVEEKPMEWYDLGMGTKTEGANEASVGAGGLMGKFARETDEVRAATGAPTGNAIQSTATFLACLVLALCKQAVLTLVTVSVIPLILANGAVTEHIVQPMYLVERRCFAEASTSVERASSAIATVKAQNAQNIEIQRFVREVNGARNSLFKQAYVWATCLGMTDFLIFSMYAVGSWYGAVLVDNGTASAETVLTVIWASLSASMALEGVLPQLVVLSKGNASLASILSIIQSRAGNYDKRGFRSGPPSHQGKDPNRPRRFRGEFDLQKLSFHYPSRPDVSVLRDITLFLPEGETTFIVGGSGSGKSTIAQLLLRMYKPVRGNIVLDNRQLEAFPDSYTRQHIAAVQQGCILFDMSVHDNVAMGIVGAGPDMYGVTRRPEDITRDDVVDACKMASIHEFIESLPNGYDTMLGTGGSQLSGGQRQRLSIARARIRDPTVLILDEATSALDATSRVNVFDAMKQWRRGSTTIVITHDLSQITPKDYVYVMAGGVVADHGFRMDLEGREGPFADMAAKQAVQPLPPRDDFEWRPAPAAIINDTEDEDETKPEQRLSRAPTLIRRSVQPRSRPTSIASLADLGGAEIKRRKTPLKVKRSGMILHGRKLSQASIPRTESQESLHLDVPEAQQQRRTSQTAPPSSFPLTTAQKRLSWNGEIALTRRSSIRSLSSDGHAHVGGHSNDGHVTFGGASCDGHATFGGHTCDGHRDFGTPRKRMSVVSFADKEEHIEAIELVDIAIEKGSDDGSESDSPVPSETAAPQPKPPGMLNLIRTYYPRLPSKPLMWFAIIGAVGHGVVVPLYSTFLAKLLAMIGASSTSAIAKQGGVLIAMALALGAAGWAQHFGASYTASQWNAQLRAEAYTRVMAQDKGWFDASANSPAVLTQCLVKDVEDMRSLVSMIVPAAVVVIVMVGFGIIWALVVSWQMTLVGVSIVPLVGVVAAVSEGYMQRAEERNKRAREGVAKVFFETLANVRGIRGMALEDCFRERFAHEADECKRTGQRAAFIVSVGQAVSQGLPLLTQALLFYVAGIFISRGILSYTDALQVMALVLFSLMFSSSFLVFLPMMSKVKVAARDFARLHGLPLDGAERGGAAQPVVTGDVAFEDVSFTYPQRPDVRVLAHFSLRAARGESVALVGASGCGKSTVAALLQRLYEPSAGRVLLDGTALSSIDVQWLRRHVGVVSQTANLFDDTILANLLYGTEAPVQDVHAACRAANIHEFIESLPHGYQTKLGENASLISGGQAQRIQIARALIRKAKILILDECTSALDVENQRIILDTIDSVKGDCTTFFITHSTEAMKRCDRIACIDDGRVVEDGSYDQLIASGGTFARLMRSGEWE